MDYTPDKSLIPAISKTLEKESRAKFAYVYGSALYTPDPRDIDIAVYSETDANPHILSADLKVSLFEDTSISPDNFDIRIINRVLEKGDIFGLLYLKNILTCGELIINKDPNLHAEFLERYGTKFRECEGLIQEVLT